MFSIISVKSNDSYLQTKTEVGEVMKTAQFSLAEAKFTCGDISLVILQNVTKAAVKVKSKKENVVGKTT